LNAFAEEIKAEETKAEETEAEEIKAEETKAEETKVEETKAEEIKAEETKAVVVKNDKKEKAELTDEEKKAKLEKAIKKAAKRKSKYPISGGLSTSYTGNHANFVESNGDFGTQILSLGGRVSYKAHRNLTLGTGVNGRKSIVNDFFSAGLAS
jgi:membrane protein involved in colicin uptake